MGYIRYIEQREPAAMNTATAAIANHLNVDASAITEVQEWARVLWVRVKGLGARFVSKKVVEVKPVFDLEAELERREKEAEQNAEKAAHLVSEIMDALPQWAAASAQYGNLFSAAIEIIEGETTFEAVVERFASKKIIVRRK
jgi:hypothetical protein